MVRWLGALGVFAGCADDVGGLNLFSPEDDIELGAQLRDEINANPDAYGPVLDPDEYPEAYAHLRRIADQVLDSGEVAYRDLFPWEMYLIHDDETLNAFCAPGGYIYVYTGILRYLEVEDHFAGVLGHEIAHAANRHSTQQMTKVYGLQVLLELVLGKKSPQVGEIAAGLVSLQFSRDDEREADEHSVIYLCETLYQSDGAAGFFEKLESEGGRELPEFLSTHPSSETRIEDIHAAAAALGCDTALHPDAQWAAFLASLPSAR